MREYFPILILMGFAAVVGATALPDDPWLDRVLQAYFPPQLARDGVEDDPEGTIYWKIAHGIRFTGMPAFRQTLSDREIWQMALFAKRCGTSVPEWLARLFDSAAIHPSFRLHHLRELMSENVDPEVTAGSSSEAVARE